MNHFEDLNTAARHLATEYSPESLSAKGGLYYGPLSVALLYYALINLYGSKHGLCDGLGLQSNLEAYLSRARQSRTVQQSPVTAGNCGVINPLLSLLALEAAALDSKSSAKRFCELAQAAMEDETKVPAVEWLYGYAGLLYLTRLVATKRDSAQLRGIQDYAIAKLLATRRPFTWHGKAYVGAAHGVAGILCQIILTQPETAPELEKDIDNLLKTQLESGNFPSSLPSAGRDRLVQFCHGAPGVITSLQSIRPFVSMELQAKIDTAVLRGRTCTAYRGCLIKESSLCHGTAGNVLAMEAEDPRLKTMLDTVTWTRVRQALGSEKMTASDHPESLWCGEAGRIWTWALLDRGAPFAFLGFNDI